MKGYLFNIQKFCLQDGAGIRTGIFLSGCPLRCRWCANPESQLPFSNVKSNSREYSIEEVVKEVVKDRAFYDKSGGGATLTGGDVFAQYGFALELCRAFRREGIHIALETAGYAHSDKFLALTGEADFVYVDCKHYDAEKHLEGTGVDNRLILYNISRLAGLSREYCVRIPMIPGYNDSLADMRNFCIVLCKLGVKRVELLPFHQFGEKKYETLGIPYAFAGVRQLHGEELSEHVKVFTDRGIEAAIGG